MDEEKRQLIFAKLIKVFDDDMDIKDIVICLLSYQMLVIEEYINQTGDTEKIIPLMMTVATAATDVSEKLLNAKIKETSRPLGWMPNDGEA